MKQLEKIAVERCYKPKTFGTVVECSLHHFADAVNMTMDKYPS